MTYLPVNHIGVTADHIERLIFADGSTYTIDTDPLSSTYQYVFASDDDNTVYLPSGTYVFHAGDGDDTIYGTDNTQLGTQERIYGGAGNDTLYGGEGVDLLYGGDGNDYLHAGTGQYSAGLYGGAGNDILISGDAGGGGLTDGLHGEDGDDIFHIMKYNVYAEGGDGYDIMYNNKLYDVDDSRLSSDLRGGAGNDVYIMERDLSNNLMSYGMSIRDTGGSYDTIVLQGDILKSSIHNNLSFLDMGSLPQFYIDVNPQLPETDDIERFVFSDGSIYEYTWLGGFNQILATGGNDTLYLTAWHDDFDALGGDDLIYALEGNDVVRGGGGDDGILGEAGNDTLYGDDGADILDGGLGNDTLYGGTGNDKLQGRDGDDTLYGGDGFDYLWGLEGNDTLYGGDTRDVLAGGNGDDYLNGGSGNDTLYGQAGADIFAFDDPAQYATNSYDTIADFSTADGDVLDISDLLSDTGYDPVTDALSDYISWTSNPSRTLLSVDADGTGSAYSMTYAVRINNVNWMADIDNLITDGTIVI